VSAGITTLRAASVAVAVVVADQIAKAAVRHSIGPTEVVHVLPGIKLIDTRNSGVAFSMFSNGGALVVIVAVLALAALLAFFFSNLSRPLVWLPTGLLLGGAAGNLIDRIRDGAVTDFVKLPHWPAFNVADMGITFGVLALVFVLERKS
jgi:signal peptidase II